MDKEQALENQDNNEELSAQPTVSIDIPVGLHKELTAIAHIFNLPDLSHAIGFSTVHLEHSIKNPEIGQLIHMSAMQENGDLSDEELEKMIREYSSENSNVDPSGINQEIKDYANGVSDYVSAIANDSSNSMNNLASDGKDKTPQQGSVSEAQVEEISQSNNSNQEGGEDDEADKLAKALSSRIGTSGNDVSSQTKKPKKIYTKMSDLY